MEVKTWNEPHREIALNLENRTATIYAPAGADVREGVEALQDMWQKMEKAGLLAKGARV